MSNDDTDVSRAGKPGWGLDLGLLLVRIAVGGLMLFHGVAKILHGIGGVKGMLAANGLPEMLGYGLYVGEVVAPILLILGLFTRVAGLVIALTMAMAVFLAHADQLLMLDDYGGLKLELNWLYFFGALALFFTGAGRISLRGGKRLLD